ncbi:MAG TPA: pyridoxamine 5'-phosphate oxidase family protein [Myxococcota bacterium]|jgi:nitroimidazol reductase NimA-like FMN-containing flavoprotein (pyridoxamine 5'-phosphate oxidase superfamily)
MTTEVLEKALATFTVNNAMTLATSGEPGADYSPWVLGTYFANEGPDLYLFLETGGKSIKNVEKNNRVAFSVSENDAMKDFVQGRGVLQLLSAGEYESVMRRMTSKMAWYKLYTPSTPVKLVTHELFVSSFASQWFPAKRWAR